MLLILVACGSNDGEGSAPVQDDVLTVDEATPTPADGLDAQTAPEIISDANAYEGKAYKYTRSGDELTWTMDQLSKGDGKYTVKVMARGELYEGAPILEVSVGTQKAYYTFNSTSYMTFQYPYNLKKGDKIIVKFINDYWGGSADKDRNVILSHLLLIGGAPTAPDNDNGNPTPEPEPTEPTEPQTDFTSEQWDTINKGNINTEETEYNKQQAEAIYGPSTGLSGATAPIEMSVTEASASFDPWLQYISADNTPFTIYSFLVRVRNTDGTMVFKTINAEQIATGVTEGWGGAAYDFRDNSIEPLTAVYNEAAGSTTISKEHTELFTHLYFGGQQGGAKGVVMAVLASGYGYMQVGVDFKNENFEDFPGQDGNDGSYHSVINSSYQRVTSTPQWFGVSNANE
ncbi:MAG: carbohydrate-binding domain-containing protein [Trueperaceae bacterium]